jgi:hypothetical protein
MKTLRFFNYAKLLGMTAIAFLVVTSCKEDDNDDQPDDYIGVWVTERTELTEDGYIEIQDIVDFSANSFVETASMKDPDTDTWIDIVGRKGKIKVVNGAMDVSLTEAGYTSVDEETEFPTGIIVYYKAGTSEFANLLVELEMSKDYKALYTVSEDELTLKADNNNNGSFDDEDEVNVFIRQE